MRAKPISGAVVIAAHAMAGDRENALATGCNGYIEYEKPINPETFVAEITRYPRSTGGELQA